MSLFDVFNKIAMRAMEKYGVSAGDIFVKSDDDYGNDHYSNDDLDIRKWDRKWMSIGRLKDADLSRFNHCVGLYRHKINGKVKYIGRAIELDNGGFRKRLSDYRRDSDSARKHKSGRKIYENLDDITTDILIVGDDYDAVALTKKLEILFIGRYKPEWNTIFN